MCNCGCNTCETKGPLLTEGKVKSLLSEGLQYHIDKKIPLFETVYRIGSKKHLSLIKEARKMYSRNVIDLCEEDEALIKTHLGEFALYEGVSIPLDLPMLNEIDEDDEYEIASRKLFDMTWDEVRRQNNQDMVQDVHDEVSKDDEEDWDDDDNFYTLRESNIPSQEEVNKFFSDTQNEMHYLNSKPVAGQKGTFNKMEVEPWDEYDLSNWKALVRKAKFKDQVNEANSKYPNFDLNKNIRYQDTVITNGMWRYTGRESGGAGVYRNLNNDQFLSFDRNDFDIFRKNLSSHFDFSESLNEDRKYNQEELLRLDLIARRRFDCDYEKCTDEQKAEVLKDKVKVGVKEALQEAKKEIDEAEFKGKKVALGKPKRGGPKAYYVYVKDGDRVKKVTFGSGGLRAKIKNKEARNAFAARHNCKDKKDRTKAGYWSCNLPRYAPALGLGAKMNTFW